jgi:hypothetical protein
MSIPTRDTRFSARTDADFSRAFVRWTDVARTQALDLTGWSLRFVVKAALGDSEDLIAIEDGAIEREDAEAGRFRVLINKAVLAEALPDDLNRLDAVFALQAEGPDGESEVWVAGPFSLARGL